MEKTDFFILAAGKGTRMKELTAQTPKPLLSLCGKPLVLWAIDYLLNEGSFDIILNFSYLKEKWASTIDKYNSISFYDTTNAENIIDSFFSMITARGEVSDTVVLMSSDIIFDFRIIGQAVEKHNKNQNEVTLVLNNECGRWKKWDYNFYKDKIIDIKISDIVKPFERYFIIFSKRALIKYTAGFTKNIGKTEAEFEKNIQYGKGLCYIIKNMIDSGVMVNYQSFTADLVNINDITDFLQAESVLQKFIEENTMAI
jgi:NDP-sugar pyrophosphorylase family protein